MLFNKFVTEVTQDTIVKMQVQPKVHKRAIYQKHILFRGSYY